MHAETLTALLDALEESPLAGRTRVFGSVANGKPVPGDLDVFVDLVGPEFEGRWDGGRDPTKDEAVALADLIRLATRYYPEFDPFVRVKSQVLVRDQWGMGWVRAKKPDEFWRVAQTEGVPLHIVAAAWREAQKLHKKVN